VLFLLRKNNFEGEFEIYHKILDLYLHSTLIAVAVLHVADYEVNLIFFVFLSCVQYETLNGKKKKRQILENIILS
jgi:hypothetical protein